MRFFNWSKNFEQTPTCDDILKRVRKTEITYWVYIIISIVIGLSGLGMIEEASNDDIKTIAMGVVITVFAIVQIALMKIWAHLRLTMYFMIWDRNNTMEAEIKKSQLQDLE